MMPIHTYIGRAALLIGLPFTTAAAQTCLTSGPIPGTPLGTANYPLAREGTLFVATGSRGIVTLIDLATGTRTDLAGGVDEPHEVAVSPDGRWGVAASFGNHLGNSDFDGRKLAVFDLWAKRLARVIDLGTYRGPHDLIFISPDRLIVTVQTNRAVLEVDVATGRVLGATPTNARGSHTLALTADAALGFTANEIEGSVSRFDLRAREFLNKYAVPGGRVEGIAVTPDGRDVWVGVEESGVRVLNAETGTVLSAFPGFRMPNRMAMSGDGRYVVITDFRCEVVQVADTRTRRILGPIAGLEGAGVARILPDNSTAVVLMLDERVVAMVDLERRRVISRYELGGARPDAAAWGPARR